MVGRWMFLLKWSLFRGYVNFPGGKYIIPKSLKVSHGLSENFGCCFQFPCHKSSQQRHLWPVWNELHAPFTLLFLHRRFVPAFLFSPKSPKSNHPPTQNLKLSCFCFLLRDFCWSLRLKKTLYKENQPTKGNQPTSKPKQNPTKTRCLLKEANFMEKLKLRVFLLLTSTWKNSQHHKFTPPPPYEGIIGPMWLSSFGSTYFKYINIGSSRIPGPI